MKGFSCPKSCFEYMVTLKKKKKRIYGDLDPREYCLYLIIICIQFQFWSLAWFVFIKLL